MARDGAEKTVLVVTDRDLRRRSKGNVQRIVSLLAGLRGTGSRVLLMAPRATVGDELSAYCDELLLVEAPIFAGGRVAEYDSSAFERAVRAACTQKSVAVVLAEYAWMAPCLRQAQPGCLRVIDAHDVLHERSASFAARGLDPWVRCTPATERRLLANADVVLALHDADAATFERLLGRSTRVTTIPHLARNDGGEYVPSGGAAVMFVGSWHDGNLGIRDFAEGSWPRIRARLPGAQLYVYGSICRRLEPGRGRRLLGVVDDLSAAYRDAALVVCPITVGGGLKIKVIEALAHGRAVVATALAVRGMPPARAGSWRVADGWAAFAEAVVALLRDDEGRHRLERDGLGYVREVYSEERAQAALRDLLATKSPGA